MINYVEFKAGNKEYKLALNTRSIVSLEKQLGHNPMMIFSNDEEIPPVTTMVAILYASILRAAGYDCGLLVLPNSIVSVVHLNDVPDDISPLPGFKTSEAKYDGTTYYPADTSSDGNPHLSTIRDCYGMDNKGNVTFYGETYRGYYGIYI